MGIGYLLGCFLSICLWNIERNKYFKWIDDKLKLIFKNNIIIILFYVAIIIGLYPVFHFFIKGEFANFITSILIIDISNSERYNLRLKDRIKFYDSLSLLTESLLCGFIAPLAYIVISGENYVGVVYFVIYNLSKVCNYSIFKVILSILNIIPSLILQGLYYIIYVFRNKKLAIEFKGDYLQNTFLRPMLNLEIMGAYIEGVNFYYHFNRKDTSYIKGYGNYNSRIDEECIKDYLSISYGIAFFIFVIFIGVMYFFR